MVNTIIGLIHCFRVHQEKEMQNEVFRFAVWRIQSKHHLHLVLTLQFKNDPSSERTYLLFTFVILSICQFRSFSHFKEDRGKKIKKKERKRGRPMSIYI